MLNSNSAELEALPQEFEDVSRRLVAARYSASSLSDFPGNLPATLEEAYSVQSASMGRWHDEVSGWKVGLIPADFRTPLNADRLAGPIFSSSVIVIENESRTSMPIFEGGFAAVEAEFIFCFAHELRPVDREYTDQELIDLVSALHVGAEIASSPMADINRLGPCCVVCDFGNNAGLLVGPEIPDWSSISYGEIEAVVSVDNTEVGRANADAIEGGLLQALRFLVTLCAHRGLVIPSGAYVSCGAVTGIHDVTTCSQASVDFGAFGRFQIDFEPMRPAAGTSARAAI